MKGNEFSLYINMLKRCPFSPLTSNPEQPSSRFPTAFLFFGWPFSCRSLIDRERWKTEEKHISLLSWLVRRKGGRKKEIVIRFFVFANYFGPIFEIMARRRQWRKMWLKAEQRIKSSFGNRRSSFQGKKGCNYGTPLKVLIYILFLNYCIICFKKGHGG